MATLTLVTNGTNSQNAERVNITFANSVAVEDSLEYAPPHGPRPGRLDGGHEWVFFNLQPSKNYNYYWLEIDGAGLQVRQYGYQTFSVPSAGDFELRTDLEVIVGQTSGTAPGLSGFVFDGLNGRFDIRSWDIKIERVGFGTLLSTKYTYNKVTGEILFLNETGQPYILSQDEEYIISFIPKIVQGASVVVTGVWNNTRFIEQSEQINASDFGRNLIKVEGISNYLKLTLPDITTVPANKILQIHSGRGLHTSFEIEAVNGNVIDFMEGGLNSLFVGVMETLKIYKQSRNGVDSFQVADAVGNWLVVGCEVSEYGQQNFAYNRVPLTGGEYDIYEYGRLYAWVNRLDGREVVNYNDHNGANIVKFSYANSAGKFKVADLRGLTPRVSDAIIRPATFLEQMILEHAHVSPSGKLPGAPFGSEGPPLAVPSPTGAYDRSFSEYRDKVSGVIPKHGLIQNFEIGDENRPKTYTHITYIYC